MQFTMKFPEINEPIGGKSQMLLMPAKGAHI
jgi:hypothetical protein